MFTEALESYGCLQKFGDFANCAAQNPESWDSCLVSNMSGNSFESGFWNAATDAMCGVGTCCEPCEAEFVDFDACFGFADCCNPCAAEFDEFNECFDSVASTATSSDW